MKLQLQTPEKALKPFLKQKPLRSQIDVFKAHLIALLDKISVIEQQPKDETEEHLKNNIRDFLRDTYYKDSNAINTKDKKDLVIHLSKETSSHIGVIIEAKRPTNLHEMVSDKNANKKALHELILYYLNERITNENNELKQLVITNINEWYIIDANVFDKIIYKPHFIKLYTNKVNDKKDNPWFYEEVAKLIDKSDAVLDCVYFNIKNYEKALRNERKTDDIKLINLYKILSPIHLLKVAATNDSNKLDKPFYFELLHIIGLEEVKEGSKNIIRRKVADVNKASFIEMAIKKLKTKGIHKVKEISNYGETTDEKHFNIALELCITWINRILFLKLLEGQLLNYHKGNKDYCFLNTATIHDFDELFKLFHQVLAVNIKDRDTDIQSKYKLVPYLNSSLFEISDLEDETIQIDSLDNNEILTFSSSTVLKEPKKKAKGLPTLEYLFQFLSAYDFASEGEEDIQEENKTIINASVLGTVFEKINGYKDGSIYTPAFITMYMCKESIRRAVIDKFNETKGWQVNNFIDLSNEINDRNEANAIINDLKICDPAVGSGHFLVSALNELITIKSELNILMDEQGKTLKDYEIEIINDELIITDENGNPFAYNPLNKESNRVQKTLFTEKQAIIENCLFGVDINPNSVKICRLRLWIELLKNAYYKAETNYTELETLPNIDINIKCGNSLLSRFTLDADLSKMLKSIKYDIKAYRGFVQDYKHEKNREAKRGLQKIIDSIKSDFRTEISKNDPKQLRLNKITGELYTLLNQTQMFELSTKEKKDRKDKQQKLETEINKIAKTIDEIKTNALYKNAFEWRFEFPEVLNNEGNFEGFDIIIGNPPYIQLQSMGAEADALSNAGYQTFVRTGDIYSLFYEKGWQLLKPKKYLIYITSNKWMRAGYGENTRRFFVECANPILLIDCAGQKIFDAATVDVNILMFSKNKNQQQVQACIIKEKVSQNLSDYFKSNATSTNFKNSESWTILSPIEQSIKAKIERIGKPLKEWDIQINYGIKTGYNEAFIIDGAKREELIQQDPKSAEIIRPILRGRDIKRYGYDFADLWLINTHNGIKEKDIKPIDISHYPAIKNHLDTFYSELEKRTDKGVTPYNLRNCAYMDDFYKQKIVWGNLNLKASYTIAPEGFFVNAPCPMIVPANKYLLIVLNSKLADYYIRNLGVTRNGGYFEYKPMFIEQLPVPIISVSHQNEFENLFKDIITKEHEKKIDEAVYKLYDLTDNEIDFIESL